MGEKNVSVRDIMVNTPIFVYKKSTLTRVFETMKKFGLDNIPIVNEDLSLSGIVNKTFLVKLLNSQKEHNLFRTKYVKDIIDKAKPPVALYPDMKIKDAYSTMIFLNAKGLPVVERPWDKKVVGFLWLDDLAKFVENEQLKVSV